MPPPYLLRSYEQADFLWDFIALSRHEDFFDLVA